MRKIILLLLSVLVGSLASVSAEEVVIHTSNLNDELYDFISNMDTYSSCNFTVEDGNIVFSSYDDFLNFFTPKIQNNLPHLDDVSVEIDGKTYPLTVVNIHKVFGNTNSAEHRFVLSTGNMVINSVIHTSSWSKIQVFGNGELKGEHTGGNSYGVVSFNFDGGSIVISESGWAQCGHAGQSIGHSTTAVVFGYLDYIPDDWVVVCSPAPLHTCVVYTEPGAQVYVGSDLVGTTDNGGYFKTQLVGGDQTLKITKDGYWDYTTTLNIQNDTTLHISLAPKTSLFRVEKNITTDLFPNSIGNVKLHLEPIRTSYGTQMQISGVDVVNVYYKNSLLAPSNGVYVLGTVDSPVDVEIQFKTPSSWGEHSFAVTITATDIEGNQYTNQEQITYEVKELPFLLQNPSWKIGENIVTITDQTGEDYSVLLSLKTVDEKEIWSQSQGFNAYDSYDFTIPINQSGDYVLEILAKGGQVKTYVLVHVIDPIRLLTKEVNASKGSVAVTKLEIENPSSDVKYYDTILVGSIFDANNTPKAEFSIAPNSKKVIEVKFEVPENITFDSYQLSVEVFEMGESDPVFQDDVVLKITESSFIVGFGDSGVPVWALAVAGVLAVCAVGAIILRRRGD